MSRLPVILSLFLILCGLIACKDGRQRFSNEDVVTGLVMDAYNKKDIERARQLIDGHHDVQNFYMAKAALHLKIRDSRGEKSLLDAKGAGFLLDQMRMDSRPGSSGRKDVQHYREYLLFLQGTPTLTDGECPAQPIGRACACRAQDIKEAFEDEAQFNSFLGLEALAWFAENLQVTCPATDIAAVRVAALAEIDPAKAADILASSGELEGLGRQLCALQDSYVNFPEKSGIAALQKLGSIQCR